MNKSAEEFETLSKVCRDIDALGECPYSGDFVDNALDEDQKEFLESSWCGPTLFSFSLVKSEEDDPLARYYNESTWNHITSLNATECELDRQWEELRKLIGAPERPESHWRYKLACWIKGALAEQEDESSQAFAHEFVSTFGPTSDYERAQKKAFEKINAAFDPEGTNERGNKSAVEIFSDLFDPDGKYDGYEGDDEWALEKGNAAFESDGGNEIDDSTVAENMNAAFDPEGKYEALIIGNERASRIRDFVWGLRINQDRKIRNKQLLKMDLERIVTQIEQAEESYLAEAEKWVAGRLELEKQLFDCSLGMHIFRRDLSADLLPIDSDSRMGHAGRRFINEYWGDILKALARYFKSLETQRQKVLTKARHKHNLDVAEKLKKSLDSTLLDLPEDFEPGYEYLAKKLGKFIEAPVSELTPKRAHDKAARQVLIREILSTWLLHSSDLKEANPPISPVKHVLNLVSAVDPTITESVIYREYKLIKADAKPE